MAFCIHKKEDVMLEVTAIENYFIQEFMLTAPGDYVKVYIYGLMQSRFADCAEDSLERFAKSLCLTEREVSDALAYWQRNGLVRLEDDHCVFLNVKGALLYGGVSPNESYLFRYAELNSQLGALLGSRKLKQSDWRIIYDWIEVLGISEEAVVMLVKYCMVSGGKRVSMQTMNATARDWAQKGIKTPEQAGEYVNTFHLTMSDANRVAAHFGFSRRVTQEEFDLYEKWTKQQGFDLEAVLAACARTTSSSNPNFAYLDKIIGTLYSKGLTTCAAIRKSYYDEQQLKEKLLECALLLGTRVSSSAESFYRQWIDNYGMTHDAVLQVLKEAGRNGVSTFKDADALMGSYVRANKTTRQEIRDEQATRKRVDADVSRIKSELGLRILSGADRKTLEGWIAKMGVELVVQGAEYTGGASSPVAYLSKILADWEKQGVKTAGQARELRGQYKKDSGPQCVSQTPLNQDKIHQMESLIIKLDGNGNEND